MADMPRPKQEPAAVTRDVVAEGFAKLPEAQQFLGVCRATLYQLMDSGELAYAKFGKCRRIPWQALRAYASSRMVQG
jgi:excisionase family DNA binding protein